MKRLVRLEKMLERGFERLRPAQAPLELVEMMPRILDEVADHVQRSEGRPAFPFTRVTVVLRLSEDQRPAARELFADLEERIRRRLALKGCEAPDELRVRVTRVPAKPEQKQARPYEVRCSGVPSAAPRRDRVPPPLRIRVVRGEAGHPRQELRLRRINIGRLESVVSTSGREVRRNHVWFVEGEDTVSRAHAHIEQSGGEFHLFDDGGAGGTRVIRRGDRLDVLARAGRGLRLEEGDRIEIGKRCVLEVSIPVEDTGRSPSSRREQPEPRAGERRPRRR